MKKLIFVFLSTFLCFSVFSQEKVLKFKGMPIDGNVYDMKNHIISKGHKFDCILEDGRVYFTGGSFAGKPVNSIGLSYNSNQSVTGIMVTFEVENERDFDYYVDYFDSLYKEKYGITGFYADYIMTMIPDATDNVKIDKNKHFNSIDYEYCHYEIIEDTHYIVEFSFRRFKTTTGKETLFRLNLVNSKNLKALKDDI